MKKTNAASAGTAKAFLPENPTSLSALREAAAHCRGCPLYKNATQTVFGEGPARARLMLIGEQPGNDEDLKGHPFVGPSGKVLARALEEAGLDRKQAYVTNAVKHFKFVQSHGRRLHQTPVRREVVACRPWLEAELNKIKPEVVVLLGAVALQSIQGGSARLKNYSGEIFESEVAKQTIATYHPSAILRAPDPQSREQKYRELVAALKLAARALSPRFRKSPRAEEPRYRSLGF